MVCTLSKTLIKSEASEIQDGNGVGGQQLRFWREISAANIPPEIRVSTLSWDP